MAKPKISPPKKVDIAEAAAQVEAPRIKWTVLGSIAAGFAVLWLLAFMMTPSIGYWGVGALPNFYARRLGPLVFPPGGTWETRTFTDPVATIGGGVRFNVRERLMIRPDVRALVVLADGHTHTLGVFVVHIAYRF